MATYITEPERMTVQATVDLSGSLNRFVTAGGALPAAAGGQALGVLDDFGPRGGVSGDTVTLVVAGGAKVEANAAIAVGAQIAVAATTGRARTAVTGDQVLGVALEAAGAQGDIISCRLDARGVLA